MVRKLLYEMMSVARLFAVFFSLVLLNALLCGDLLAQKRKPMKSKKRTSDRQSDQLFLWAEGYGGYGAVFNSGDFREYQQQNYKTENPSFSISGDFPAQYAPVFGSSFHLGLPLKNPFIKFASAGFSLGWSQRNLQHNFTFTNTSLPYKNAILVSDAYKADFLGTEFQIRFGGKIYGVLGIRADFLLSGMRERSQKLEGDSIQNGKAVFINEKWSLKGAESIRQKSPGWHLALGYNPLPMFGIRCGFLQSGGFFSSGPDFISRQIYLALCFSYLK
jgi:hypothetical protein